jgi:hypothetical protein
VYIEFGPHLPARRAAGAYLQSIGDAVRFPRAYTKLDHARAKRIAQLFEDMQPSPNERETMQAYKAMVTETLAQWEFIKTAGLHVELNPNGPDPYVNPRNAILHIVRHNHLYILPTRSAFGDTEFDVTEQETNPLLADTSDVISG